MKAAPSLLVFVMACSSCSTSAPAERSGPNVPAVEHSSTGTSEGDMHGSRAAEAPPPGRAVAIFAGGCFWCMEAPFDELEGVDSTTSGYTGGRTESPSYDEVSSGGTGHAEAIRIVYDPARITYERLLDVFWHNIDPTQDDGQFCDHGTQYRSEIFVLDADQRRAAEASRARVAEQLDEEIVTAITDASTFWIAEDYHQDYYRTNPVRYTMYRTGCGRDRRLEQIWGESAAH
jgi:peptide-methionine (S)-S-oxide reductase